MSQIGNNNSFSCYKRSLNHINQFITLAREVFNSLSEAKGFQAILILCLIL